MADFLLEIDKFIEGTNVKIDTAIRKITLDMFRRIILRTPVGNPDLWKSSPPPGYVGGRLRANWQCAIGNIPDGTLDLHDATGTATISRVTAEALKMRAGEMIWLVNNLAYAIPIEYGHSSQAPQGMVRVTVSEFGAIATDAANQVRQAP